MVRRADPAARRLVVEPDVRNHLALRRLELTGFTFADEIDMPDKRAQLAFLTRDRFDALHGDLSKIAGEHRHSVTG